jgi:hypothetical protein
MSKQSFDHAMGSAVQLVLDKKGTSKDGTEHIVAVRDKNGTIFRVSISLLPEYPAVPDSYRDCLAGNNR